MQTVINYNIINGDIIGSAVLQGSNGNNVAVASTPGLCEFECELLRMFRGLDVKRKIAALSYLCNLENMQAITAGCEV